MTKVTIIKSDEIPRTKRMSEMEPGEICIIDDYVSKHHGNVVMRTLSSAFEVMDLTEFEFESCWDMYNSVEVKPAPKGTKIIFEVK